MHCGSRRAAVFNIRYSNAVDTLWVRQYAGPEFDINLHSLFALSLILPSFIPFSMPIPLAHENAKGYTQATFKPLLNKLVKTPEYFSPHDLHLSLEHIFTPGAIEPVQIGAFLAALHISRLERRPESLATAASLLRARAVPAAVDRGDEDFVVDIVGTGGDGHDTFNVSTTAAIVAAGAGARVIKVCLMKIVQGDLPIS